MSTASTVVHSLGGKEYHKGELCLKEIDIKRTVRDNSIVLGQIQSRCLGSVREWLIGKSNSNPV